MKRDISHVSLLETIKKNKLAKKELAKPALLIAPTAWNTPQLRVPIQRASLPADIWDCIIGKLSDVRDLSRLGRTCKALGARTGTLHPESEFFQRFWHKRCGEFVCALPDGALLLLPPWTTTRAQGAFVFCERFPKLFMQLRFRMLYVLLSAKDSTRLDYYSTAGSLSIQKDTAACFLQTCNLSEAGSAALRQLPLGMNTLTDAFYAMFIAVYFGGGSPSEVKQRRKLWKNNSAIEQTYKDEEMKLRRAEMLQNQLERCKPAHVSTENHPIAALLTQNLAKEVSSIHIGSKLEFARRLGLADVGHHVRDMIIEFILVGTIAYWSDWHYDDSFPLNRQPTRGGAPVRRVLNHEYYAKNKEQQERVRGLATAIWALMYCGPPPKKRKLSAAAIAAAAAEESSGSSSSSSEDG